jgi:molybdopterin molybdotransferase
MISVPDAKKLIEQRITPSETISIDLTDAAGLVLAKDIKAQTDVPPFNNSAMDGYAIRYDKSEPELKLAGKIKAGDLHGYYLNAGEATRIFTGAPLPEGSDTVIQQELTSEAEGYVKLNIQGITKGSNVRLKGSQNKAGDTIAKKGSKITPGMIALLASVGRNQVIVFNAPSVGLIITGNELQKTGTSLKEGFIYNSNEPSLISYLSLCGIKNKTSCIISDDRNKLKIKLQLYLKKFDVVIVTGGISVGEYDYVKIALEESGVEELFYKVKQKPGKPLYVGCLDNKWIFALPGNPAAVITCFNQYVKPTLSALMGYKNTFEPDCVLPLANNWQKSDALTHFLKAKKENNKVIILPDQQSFNLLSFNEADCFVLIDNSQNSVAAGSMVDVFNI